MSPPSPALHELTASELIAGYRRRDFSPVDVTRSVLGHIELWEYRLQALYLHRPEVALQQARASERRWLRGAALGPLDGVPVTIKENIATQGDPMPTGNGGKRPGPGCRRRASSRARARVRRRHHRQKTKMPDYGMVSSGLSSFHKLARNPWDLTREARGLQRRRGRGRSGRLWAIAPRHRHRRFSTAARRLVRHFHAQAQLGARSHRSALYWMPPAR